MHIFKESYHLLFFYNDIYHFQNIAFKEYFAQLISFYHSKFSYYTQLVKKVLNNLHFMNLFFLLVIPHCFLFLSILSFFPFYFSVFHLFLFLSLYLIELYLYFSFLILFLISFLKIFFNYCHLFDKYHFIYFDILNHQCSNPYLVLSLYCFLILNRYSFLFIMFLLYLKYLSEFKIIIN